MTEWQTNYPRCSSSPSEETWGQAGELLPCGGGIQYIQADITAQLGSQSEESGGYLGGYNRYNLILISVGGSGHVSMGVQCIQADITAIYRI